MISAASRHNRLLAVGLYKRFFPACEAIRGIIKERTFGDLRSFNIEEGGKFGWQAASDSFFRRSMTPGGVLYDIGVHVIDLLLWWLGTPAELSYEDDAMGGLEANCRLRLGYGNGGRGEVRLSRDWPTEDVYTFVFDRGVVTWEAGKANELQIRADGMRNPLKGGLVEYPDVDCRRWGQRSARTAPQSFIEQLQNVIGAIRGEQPLRVPGEEGLRSLQIIERCYAERRLMEMPWLSKAEMAQAERLASADRLASPIKGATKPPEAPVERPVGV